MLTCLICLLLSASAAETPVPEAYSLFGQPLFPIAFSPLQNESLMAQLQMARDALRDDSCVSSANSTLRHDPAKVVWLGRRTAYRWHFQEALRLYTGGIADHPSYPKLYRHRGHRFITTRNFSKAQADLSRAQVLLDEQKSPDEWEPDGSPNTFNIPLSSTHFNVGACIRRFMLAEYNICALLFIPLRWATTSASATSYKETTQRH
jgi:hypothetical protein